MRACAVRIHRYIGDADNVLPLIPKVLLSSRTVLLLGPLRPVTLGVR